MNPKNYDVVHNLLMELQERQNQIQEKIDANLLKIQEAKIHLDSIMEKCDVDFKEFSPRTPEVTHKKEISKLKEEICTYENENVSLFERSEYLILKISTIDKILCDENEHSVKMFNVQEEERARISRELHDTSLQNLTHLVHKIELSSLYIDKDPIQAKLELSIINKSLKAIIEEIRNTIFNIRPMEFDDLGIKAAFERLISIINKDNIYEIDMNIENVSCETNTVLLTLYRAVQECLNNIVKHAEASKIIFHAENRDGKYLILIEDNGKGFNIQKMKEKKKNHFGMSLIKERINILHGNVKVSSSNKGTRIEIEIPIIDNLISR